MITSSELAEFRSALDLVFQLASFLGFGFGLFFGMHLPKFGWWLEYRFYIRVRRLLRLRRHVRQRQAGP